ncbi:MAG: Tetratricopeptide repeat protein [bacterium ADurb.Bin236]|nr:MAG: Tetratricopeptide repeat protein [bacterium ADurb.Bin236]
MGFRLFRRIKIAPGVTLNLSKSGLSTSFGPRGAKFTVGPKGTRQTVGLPGTGLYYTTSHGYGTHKTSSRATSPKPLPTVAPVPPPGLNLSFFQRLTTPENEKSFIEGCKELVGNNPEKALEHFNTSKELADADFMGGIIAFKLERLTEAADHLNGALNQQSQLGKLLNKHGIEAGANISITDEITAFVGADLRGVLLALTEVYQRLDKSDSALQCLYKLRELDPNDLLIRLSLVELYYDIGKTDTNQDKAIINLTQNIENESAIHGALLLYRAKAMRMLGLPDAAVDVLTKTMGRRKDRPQELLLALRYERGLVYEALGKQQQARKDFEKVYSEAPDFEEVSKKLELS